MSEFLGIYTIWLREVKRDLRERSRLVGNLVMPVLWLVVFGSGMGFAIRFGGETSYQAFLFPGIIGMTLLFRSVFSGISVVWDREFGFLKEIMVAPISRTSIVIGKTLGGCTSSIVQGVILMALFPVVGVSLSPVALLLAFPTMFLITLGLVGVGVTIASLMRSFEGFNVIMSLLIQPMFFLSGALFPIDRVPEWLKVVIYVNPLAYGVDALRGVILGVSLFPMFLDYAVMAVFAGLMVALSTVTFSLRK